MKKLYFSLLTFLFLVVAHAQIVNIPDVNFKAKLLAASPSNTTASTETPVYNSSNNSWTVSSYNKIDTNNDGEIQVSEAQAIKFLKVSDVIYINNLEGIESFTNIIFLNCGNNQLTSLNVQGLTNLQSLHCSSNQLTSLNVQGLTNLQDLYCYNNQLASLNVLGLTNLQDLYCYSNQLTSLDVQGLANLQTLYCSFNQLTSLNVQGLANLQRLYCAGNDLTSLNVQGLANLQRLDCISNEISSLNIQGLSNLEHLYCYNNQLTSLNVQGSTNLQTLSCSNNQLPSLNVEGLTNLQTLYCSENQLTSLNVQGLANLQQIRCSYNQLTALFIKNNYPNWTELTFGSNPNLTFICADEEDLTLVQQKINQYGYAATCQVNSYCSFTPGGVFYTIQGNNNLDASSNGCDVSDSICPNLKFNISNGTISGSLISNALGNYSIPVSAGNHTITPQFENPNYFTVSPANAIVSFPTQTSPFIQNFCIAPNGVHHDLEVVVIPLEPARPGFDATYKIKYKNKGNLNETATVNFNYNEAILDFVSSSSAATMQSAGTLSWDLGTIAPFQTGEIVVTLNVNSPMETPAVNADDILNHTANIVGLTTDETPDDTTFTLSQVVVNSFDPNDKTCLEGNNINPDMIGKYVHYKIRFENTGTFPAQNIVVKDLIDTTKFDLSTLQMTDASHNCVTRITNPNKVEFIFENINLPFDDANNDGYVVFKIKTKPTLTVNSTISNLANIYFDYNFPIVTNTATSTFQVLKTDSFAFDNYFSIYPNPVKNELNLNTQQATTVYSLSIYNILGQLVQTTTNPEKTIDVSGLKTGNYIVKVTTDKGVSSSKFVKE